MTGQQGKMIPEKENEEVDFKVNKDMSVPWEDCSLERIFNFEVVLCATGLFLNCLKLSCISQVTFYRIWDVQGRMCFFFGREEAILFSASESQGSRQLFESL
jgi:hypothetical protein